MPGRAGRAERLGPGALRVTWRLGEGSGLHLLANLSGAPLTAEPPPGAPVFATSPAAAQGRLEAWGLVWTLGGEP